MHREAPSAAGASERALRKSGTWAGLLVALVLTCGCKGRSEPRPVASAVVVPAPPPPKGLAAEILVPRPNEFWAGLRGLLGTLGAFLPKGAELAFGSSVGLPPVPATALDMSAPLVGALAIDGARRGIVLGARLTSGAELVAALTTGNAPTHRVQLDGAVRVLEPLATAPERPALGVLDDTLLVGTRADLTTLGPYIVRGLGRQALPKPDGAAIVRVSAAALRDVVVPFVRAEVEQKRAFLEQALKVAESERGRSADLADPRAVLRGLEAASEAALGALANARGIEARLLPEPSRLILDVDLGVPASPTSTFADVPLASLFAAPEDAVLRISIGRTVAEAPADLGRILNELFGERLAAAEQAKLEDALRSVEAGRGRTQLFGSRGDGVFWSGDVADGPQLEAGLTKLVALLGKKPLSALAGIARVRPGKHGTSTPDSVHSVAIELAPSGKARSTLIPSKLGVVWAVGAREFTLAAAAEPGPLFDALAARRASGATGGALLAPFERASVAGFVELGTLPLFGTPGLGKTVGFALARDAGTLRLRIAATPAAVAALTRMVQ